MGWGVVVPRLYARGWTAQRLDRVRRAAVAWWCWCGRRCSGPARDAPGPGRCFASPAPSSSLSQPAVGQAFPAALAGRALSAYNLIIFAGVFAVQWGIGMRSTRCGAGWDDVSAYRGAFALLRGCCGCRTCGFWRDDRATSGGG